MPLANLLSDAALQRPDACVAAAPFRPAHHDQAAMATPVCQAAAVLPSDHRCSSAVGGLRPPGAGPKSDTPAKRRGSVGRRASAREVEAAPRRRQARMGQRPPKSFSLKNGRSRACLLHRRPRYRRRLQGIPSSRLEWTAGRVHSEEFPRLRRDLRTPRWPRATSQVPAGLHAGIVPTNASGTAAGKRLCGQRSPRSQPHESSRSNGVWEPSRSPMAGRPMGPGPTGTVACNAAPPAPVSRRLVQVDCQPINSRPCSCSAK